MQNTMNFLNNWSFWAVVVASISVLLSQIPPIHEIFKGAKLDLDIYSRVSITHKVGNPNLQIYLLLSNVGGRRVKETNINVVISTSEDHEIELPAQNFYKNQNDEVTLIFTKFNLEPKEEWSHSVNFYRLYDRDDEKQYLKMENDLSTDYKLYKEKSKDNNESNETYEHPINLVQPVFEFFERKHFWKVGEYKMSIRVSTDFESANITKNYRFTIFESHEETLNLIKDYYKYGGGLYWTPNIKTAVFLDTIEVAEN